MAKERKTLMKRPIASRGILFLGLALGGCAGTSVKPEIAKGADMAVPSDLESALRLAQRQRKQGDLDGATKTLSQLTIFAPDDARILGEYGKTLLNKGRTGDAIAFLERAIELQPSDWSFFSAMGVAYAQNNDPQAARRAFARALALKPGEPSVLNNAALARLQAGDLAGAEQLLLQAAQSPMPNPRIEKNLALVQELKSKQPLAAAETSQTMAASAITATVLRPQPQAMTASAVSPAKVSLSAPTALAIATVEPVNIAPVNAVPVSTQFAVASAAAKGSPPVPRTPAAENPMKSVSSTAKASPARPYYVQVGTFAVEQNAVRITARLQVLDAHMSPAIVNGRPFYVVRLGPFGAHDDAAAMVARVKDMGVTDVQIMNFAPHPRPAPAAPQLRLSENGALHSK
jgi:Flp pilus assembly protein TadD